MLAYLLERVVEVETEVPFAQIRSALMRVRAVELTFDQQTVWETSTTPPELRRLLAKMKLSAPAKVLTSQIP